MTSKWKARIQWAQCLNEQFGLHSHALVGFGSHLKSLGTNKLIFIVTRTHNSSFQEWLLKKKWSQALPVLLSLFSHYKIKASFLSKWPKIRKKKNPPHFAKLFKHVLIVPGYMALLKIRNCEFICHSQITSKLSQRPLLCSFNRVLIPPRIVQHLNLNWIKESISCGTLNLTWVHTFQCAHCCLLSGFRHRTRSHLFFSKNGKIQYRLVYLNFPLEACAAFSINYTQTSGSWMKCPQSPCSD